MIDDLDYLAPAVQRLVDNATRPLRARVLALQAQLVWQDERMTDALTARIVDILGHCDAAASGELTPAELTAAFDATVERWNAVGKANGKAKTNGAAKANGAHLL